jgi:hypothetical protein
MPAMPAPVHEQVQERAGGQQDPGQRAENMRPVLGPQEEGGYGDERQQDEPGLGAQEPGESNIISSSRAHLLLHGSPTPSA